MKKFINFGIALLFTFILSSTSFASLADSQQINKIVSIQPILDQEQAIGELKEMVPTSNDGVYQYYDDPSGIVKKIRVFSIGDRTEIEMLNNEGQWRLAQIRNDETGVIANYIKGEFVGYTRKLENEITAHYLDHYNKVVADKTGRNADFYTRFTEDGIYACFCNTLENALNETAHLRVLSFEERYTVETKNSSGKWNLAMIIHTNTGTIANYEDRKFVNMSKITPNGEVSPMDNELASL